MGLQPQATRQTYQRVLRRTFSKNFVERRPTHGDSSSAGISDIRSAASTPTLVSLNPTATNSKPTSPVWTNDSVALMGGVVVSSCSPRSFVHVQEPPFSLWISFWRALAGTSSMG